MQWALMWCLWVCVCVCIMSIRSFASLAPCVYHHYDATMCIPLSIWREWMCAGQWKTTSKPSAVFDSPSMHEFECEQRAKCVDGNATSHSKHSTEWRMRKNSLSQVIFIRRKEFLILSFSFQQNVDECVSSVYLNFSIFINASHSYSHRLFLNGRMLFHRFCNDKWNFVSK